MASWGGDRLAKVGQAPFLVLAVAGGVWVRALAGRGPIGQPGRDLLVRLVDAALALLVRAQRRHDLRGGLSHGRLLLSPGFARRGRHCGLLSRGAGRGRGAWDQGRRGRLRSAAARSGDRWRFWSKPVPARTKIVRTLVIVLGPARFRRLLVHSQRLADRKSALSAGGPTAGPQLLHGWYRSRGDANQSSTTCLSPIGGRWAISCSPSSTPGWPRFWIAALVVGWAIKNPTPTGARRWIAIFSIMAVLNVVLYWVFIPYRTQQRFMLQAWGWPSSRWRSLLDRSRWLRRAAALLLATASAHAQGWPFARADGSHSLGPHAARSPTPSSAPVLLFSRIARAFQADGIEKIAAGTGAAWSGSCCASLLMVGAGAGFRLGRRDRGLALGR